MNLTMSVSYYCTSHYKTCDVWQCTSCNFMLFEHNKVFASTGEDACRHAEVIQEQLERGGLPVPGLRTGPGRRLDIRMR
jgi:hypothetical protein